MERRDLIEKINALLKEASYADVYRIYRLINLLSEDKKKTGVN